MTSHHRRINKHNRNNNSMAATITTITTTIAMLELHGRDTTITTTNAVKQTLGNFSLSANEAYFTQITTTISNSNNERHTITT
jgi:hypothetical protein